MVLIFVETKNKKERDEATKNESKSRREIPDQSEDEATVLTDS
jgi:hypothetical protein